MFRIRITESARQDLFEIASFVVEDRDRNETALTCVDQLEYAILSLKTLLERGAIRITKC